MPCLSMAMLDAGKIPLQLSMPDEKTLNRSKVSANGTPSHRCLLGMSLPTQALGSLASRPAAVRHHAMVLSSLRVTCWRRKETASRAACTGRHRSTCSSGIVSSNSCQTPEERRRRVRARLLLAFKRLA